MLAAVVPAERRLTGVEAPAPAGSRRLVEGRGPDAAARPAGDLAARTS